MLKVIFIKQSYFIEVSVPSQTSQQACICVLIVVSIFLFFLWFFDWILELFW